MTQLRQEYQRIVDLDTEVVVLGPEKRAAFQKYWKKERLPFIGLPDPEHTVLTLYGQEVKIFRLGRLPAQILVDSSGIIRAAYYGNSMADIPPIAKTIGGIKEGLLE